MYYKQFFVILFFLLLFSGCLTWMSNGEKVLDLTSKFMFEKYDCLEIYDFDMIPYYVNNIDKEIDENIWEVTVSCKSPIIEKKVLIVNIESKKVSEST